MTLAVDKTSATLAPMNERARGPWLVLGLVLAWRLALLVFTAQPIPANDAFLFDGAVVNWLMHGQYFNPSLAEAFPISGHQVFAAYPPVYQAVLLLWMSVCGTSVLSAMWLLRRPRTKASMSPLRTAMSASLFASPCGDMDCLPPGSMTP